MYEVACFQIFYSGKIKALTRDQYMKRLNRKGYTVGYTDGNWLLFARNGTVIILDKRKLEAIYSLKRETVL